MVDKKNSLYKKVYKSRGTASNPRKQILDDANNVQRNVEQGENLMPRTRYANVKSNASKKETLFARGVLEMKVRRELFILEGDDSFEMRTIRGKMTEVIKRSSEELKEHFYEKGVQNQLPDNWTDFKEFVVDFCKGQSLDTMIKYKNESWLEFVCRL
jgi:hypothetical protein